MNELELVKKELEKHRGKGNTISAGEIADIFGRFTRSIEIQLRKRPKILHTTKSPST